VPGISRWLATLAGLFSVLGISACIISTDHNEASPRVALPLLLNVLKDPDPGQRQTAAQSLGKIGDPQAIPALVESLRDPDPGVRRQAAWALGMIGDGNDAVRLGLINLLFDPDLAVQETAAWALGQTGDASTGLSILRTRLWQPQNTSDTKRLAAAALAGMELRSSLDIVHKLLQDRHPVVRRWAVAALAEIASEEAVPTLSQSLQKDPDPQVRVEAAFRLGKIGNAQARAALTAALKDPDENVRRIAGAALRDVVHSNPPEHNAPAK
jgi:HEAT repeat protein